MFGFQKETHPLYETLAQVFYIGTGLSFALLVSLTALDFIGQVNITLPFLGTLVDTSFSVTSETINTLLTALFGCGIAGLLMEAMQLRRKPDDDDFKDTQNEMKLR